MMLIQSLYQMFVINLNKVEGTITNKDGEFEISAQVNDTLFFSYLGFKSIKIRVTNDLIKFQNSKIKLTELAYALEEVVVSPYQLTGYLEIDARNIPLSKTYRYNIPGLPTRGYEAGTSAQVPLVRFLLLYSIQWIFFITSLVKNQGK